MKYILSFVRKVLLLSTTDAEMCGINCNSWQQSIGKFKTYNESNSALMKQVFVWSVEFFDNSKIEESKYRIVYSEIEQIK